MSKQLKLKIITPERLVLEEVADQVSIPTILGEITVLPNHIPLVVELAKGDVVSYINKEPKPYAVVGGFIDVKKNEDGITEVAILADFAEHVSALSEDKIREAKERAEQLKKEMENKTIVDFEYFQSELERSLTRVKIADKWKSKKYRK